MNDNERRLIEIGDGLFSTFQPWNTLRQELCELFYPMRADFIRMLAPGDDFQMDLMDSTTVLARETLGNLPHSVLRQGDWFNISTGDDEEDKKPANMTWFDEAKEAMRNFMYAPRANFVLATSEADHDWVTIGNPVISVEENSLRNGLLYRAWHPKSVVWMSNADGQIDHVQRKIMMTARNIARRWPNCDQKIKAAAKKTPNQEFEIRHILMCVDDMYGDDKVKRRRYSGKPYISVYLDRANEMVLQETPSKVFNYLVPRWKVLSNVPIGFSPVTINCLPDARMLQSLARILLEQGEKGVDPPMLAKGDLFRGDVNLYAGGLTYVDLEDDQKLQDKLMLLDTQSKLNVGVEMKQDVRNLIAESFLLNKLTLPQVHEMTAFETNVRLDEYRRAALPFFGPIEAQYHLPMLDLTFEILLNNKALPAPPKELLDTDVTFKFEGPLNTLEGRQVVAAFQESVQIIAAAAQFNQQVVNSFDLTTATKDAVRGAGAEPEWFVDDETAQQATAEANKAAQLAQAAQVLNAGGLTAKNVGEGTQALQQAGLAPGGAPSAAPAQ
jgi:hypothetical protein